MSNRTVLPARLTPPDTAGPPLPAAAAVLPAVVAPAPVVVAALFEHAVSAAPAARTAAATLACRRHDRGLARLIESAMIRIPSCGHRGCPHNVSQVHRSGWPGRAAHAD